MGVRVMVVAASAATAAVGVLAAASVASAQHVDVAVDDTKVEIEEADEAHTATVGLLNLTTGSVAVSGDIGDPGCTVTADPEQLPSGRRVEVVFTFEGACELDDGADLAMTFTPASVVASAMTIAVTPAEEPARAQWWILWVATLPASVLSVGVVADVEVARRRRNTKKPDEASLRARHDADEVRVRAAFTARGLTPPGAKAFEYPVVTWSSKLQAFGTSWSFKDNWVSNISIGSTAIVALLAASDVLEAVLGEKPTVALGLITVAGAISAALVALGPLLVKLAGDDLAVPTVGGTIAAGLLTLGGTLFQIGAITIQGMELADGLMWIPVALAGLAVASIVTVYARKALRSYVVKGTAPASPRSASDVERAAWVAAAAFDDVTVTSLSALEIDEILAANKARIAPGEGATVPEPMPRRMLRPDTELLGNTLL